VGLIAHQVFVEMPKRTLDAQIGNLDMLDKNE
jgi:hypothetical protein